MAKIRSAVGTAVAVVMASSWGVRAIWLCGNSQLTPPPGGLHGFFRRKTDASAALVVRGFRPPSQESGLVIPSTAPNHATPSHLDRPVPHRRAVRLHRPAGQ